jgi:hypothetical protein
MKFTIGNFKNSLSISQAANLRNAPDPFRSQECGHAIPVILIALFLSYDCIEKPDSSYHLLLLTQPCFPAGFSLDRPNI